jgi:hypothetical protein
MKKIVFSLMFLGVTLATQANSSVTTSNEQSVAYRSSKFTSESNLSYIVREASSVDVTFDLYCDGEYIGSVTVPGASSVGAAMVVASDIVDSMFEAAGC